MGLTSPLEPEANKQAEEKACSSCVSWSTDTVALGSEPQLLRGRVGSLRASGL